MMVLTNDHFKCELLYIQREEIDRLCILWAFIMSKGSFVNDSTPHLGENYGEYNTYFPP